MIRSITRASLAMVFASTFSTAFKVDSCCRTARRTSASTVFSSKASCVRACEAIVPAFAMFPCWRLYIGRGTVTPTAQAKHVLRRDIRYACVERVGLIHEKNVVESVGSGDGDVRVRTRHDDPLCHEVRAIGKGNPDQLVFGGKRRLITTSEVEPPIESSFFELLQRQVQLKRQEFSSPLRTLRSQHHDRSRRKYSYLPLAL